MQVTYLEPLKRQSEPLCMLLLDTRFRAASLSVPAKHQADTGRDHRAKRGGRGCDLPDTDDRPNDEGGHE